MLQRIQAASTSCHKLCPTSSTLKASSSSHFSHAHSPSPSNSKCRCRMRNVDSNPWAILEECNSLEEMESVYGLLKRKHRLTIQDQAIRAMAVAYIKENKFHRLGEFVRDAGVESRTDLRPPSTNLLWNLLLLSYAASFRMKSLQREFLNMTHSGFSPDITTFNIRAIVFSKMSLFWDLHLTLRHMKHLHIPPDLVTFGCLVDAYFDRGLAGNLQDPFLLNQLCMADHVLVLTDPLVFQVFGKGDFHSSSESFMEWNNHLTYPQLLAAYLKKQHRKHHIFWNY